MTLLSHHGFLETMLNYIQIFTHCSSPLGKFSFLNSQTPLDTRACRAHSAMGWDRKSCRYNWATVPQGEMLSDGFSSFSWKEIVRLCCYLITALLGLLEDIKHKLLPNVYKNMPKRHNKQPQVFNQGLVNRGFANINNSLILCRGRYSPSRKRPRNLRLHKKTVRN